MALRTQTTVLQMEDTPGSATFTAVSEVLDINPVGIARNAIDVTHLNTTGGYREFTPGLIDGGDIGATLLFDPADSTHDDTTGLLSTLADTTSRLWRVVFPGGSPIYEIPGILTGMPINGALDDVFRANVTIKVAAAPDYSAT